MRWIDELARSPDLPALWIIQTGAQPLTRPERGALRQATSRKVVALQTGAAEGDIEIAHEASGRPIIMGAGQGLQLSHATRDGIVIVGLSAQPIGVDIECVAAGPVPMQALHRAEQLWLAQAPPAERERRFAALWAAKEAYGKWAGTGLPQTDAFALLPDAETGWRVAGAAPARITTREITIGGVELVTAVAIDP